MTSDELREAIQRAEWALEDAQRAYLAGTGWTHTSSTPGSYWLWVKELPDGRTAMVPTSLAINMQQSLDPDDGAEEG